MFRRCNMVAALIALIATVPNGAYGLRDLCAKLTEATGTHYTVDDRLGDYPVFVFVKDGDDQRILDLTAKAFHGEWKSNGSTVQLRPVPFEPDADLAEFTRQYALATKGNAALAALPSKEVFGIAPGQILRFSNMPRSGVRPLPKELAKTAEPGAFILVRRFSGGMFESAVRLGKQRSGLFSGGSEITLDDLNPAVAEAFGPQLSKVVLSPESRARLGSPDAMVSVIRSGDLVKQEPIAMIASQPLLDLGKALDRDFVLAMPDMMLFSTMGWSRGDGTASSMLSSLTTFVSWQVSPDALIGSLRYEETKQPSQTKRAVLSKYINAVGSSGAASAKSVSDYVVNQRPYASNSWVDAMLLAVSGITFDQSYLGDYPYNMRLYSSLSKGDWNLIRSGQEFTMAMLSTSAQQMMTTLLLQTRNDLNSELADPAFWSSLAQADLKINATLTESPAVTYDMDGMWHVSEVGDAAANYERLMKKYGREPLYRLGTQRKLELNIHTGVQGEQYATGFAEFELSGNGTAVKWTNLPSEMVTRFKTVLASIKEAEQSTAAGQP